MNPYVLRIAIAGVFAVLGCGGPRQSAPPSSAAVDSVRILSISPGIETPLKVGAAASFSVEVEYNLVTSASGTLTLVIQQGESGREPLANETVVVQKGKGTITLRKEISVPDTAAVQVFVPLTAQGESSTSVVDSRAYGVVNG
jgi:hypothetical protein